MDFTSEFTVTLNKQEKQEMLKKKILGEYLDWLEFTFVPQVYHAMTRTAA